MKGTTDMNKFVNLKEFHVDFDQDHESTVRGLDEVSPTALYIDKILSLNELTQLQKQLSSMDWVPVGYSGIKGDYQPGDPIGSWRISLHNQEYADKIWERIGHHIPSRTIVHPCDIDGDEGQTWIPVGVSPLWRFIKYTDGNKLYIHYDFPYVETNTDVGGLMTQQSLVIYVSKHDVTGGGTRFLNDPQKAIPVKNRDLSDQPRFANLDEVFAVPSVELGDAIVFDHRMLHDGQEVKGPGEKIIIRTDIMFQRVA